MSIDIRTNSHICRGPGWDPARWDPHADFAAGHSLKIPRVSKNHVPRLGPPAKIDCRRPASLTSPEPRARGLQLSDMGYQP